jgi:hypothetical protein
MDSVVTHSTVIFQPLQRWKFIGAVFQWQYLKDQDTE